jgi:molybdenum cofactor cytidylyltransferase
MNQFSRLFAVIPAAGRSRRMASPKLLLPWNGTTVIEQLLRTLARPEIAATVIVVRPDDRELQQVVRQTTAICVVPEADPPDMRHSIELGLRAIHERFQPRGDDGWLLIPADHPLIEAAVLDGLLTRWSQRDCSILVPTFSGRRGHPTLFRWSFAAGVEQLPHDIGLNVWLRSSPELVTEWPTEHESILADLDTPEDYARWQTWLQDQDQTARDNCLGE